MTNQTVITEFILSGLSSDPEVHHLLFFVFLVIYVSTLLANSMIILIISEEPSLRSPMFFFLKNLAWVDICYSSVTIPKMLEIFVSKETSISMVGCYLQIFFFIYFACAEVFLLAAMSYDRYAAICDPLHYLIIMKKQMCHQLVIGSIIMGLLDALFNTVPLLYVSFCRFNIISHYTCDLPAVLSLSCSDTFTNQTVIFAATFLFGFIPLLLTLISYARIISTILKIHSAKGRSKAFSTCSSHLIVVCLFYFSAFFRYMKPSSNSLSNLDRVLSIQYLILTPLLNPVIYCLRNNEIKTYLWKRIGKCM
ncbi:olfactory receptor 1440-like [Sceloporus undulatus]|uniref:olfactory receptor 1440-like n=1 Tax=Sceloporus undulatus TaxID=8520 RepID=UPI001C4CD024|nr:olfactory receptor 1440-like [Sceloporus undulatus]